MKNTIKKNKHLVKFSRAFGGFKFDIGNPIFTVLVPLVLGFSFTLIWPTHVKPTGEGIILLFFMSILLQPIGEEILFRGVFLNFFLDLIEDSKKKIESKYIIGVLIGLLLFIQAFLFMFGHQQAFNLPLLVDGVLFGVLFLVFDRNILPPIVAHISGNFLVFVLTYNIFGF